MLLAGLRGTQADSCSPRADAIPILESGIPELEAAFFLPAQTSGDVLLVRLSF
jgi:hypothetical protein